MATNPGRTEIPACLNRLRHLADEANLRHPAIHKLEWRGVQAPLAALRPDGSCRTKVRDAAGHRNFATARKELS